MESMSSSLFSNLRADLLAAALEFFGTTLFFLVGLGGIQASAAESASNPSAPTSGVLQVLYISTSMGFSLFFSAFLFYRVTGAAFNPNVSLALLLVGAMKPVRFVLYCIAQLAGGIIASALVMALTPGPLASNPSLQKGVNPAQGVFIEAFCTAALCLAVLLLAVEKHKATPLAPVGIAITLFACHLFAVFYTGAALNTARAFGPAVVTSFAKPNHWVYWVGPFIGSLLAAGFYTVLKRIDYGMLNPGQDFTDDGPQANISIGLNGPQSVPELAGKTDSVV